MGGERERCRSERERVVREREINNLNDHFKFFWKNLGYFIKLPFISVMVYPKFNDCVRICS